MTTGSLYIHPNDPEQSVDTETLASVLQEGGLIGDPFGGQDPVFLVGEKFLQLITFMGCSPYIELEPPSSKNDKNSERDFCHIVLHGFSAPRLLIGANTRPPRCPECGKQAVEQLDQLRSDSPKVLVDCNHCGKPAYLSALRWRRDGGIASTAIEVVSVFPGEAAPVDGLMKKLSELTNCGWRYFYLTH